MDWLSRGSWTDWERVGGGELLAAGETGGLIVVVFVLQTMELARNPAMLQELMRSQDRAMSNLEVGAQLHHWSPAW